MADKDERIAELEAGARESDAHIRRLDADALAYEEHIHELDARALVRDGRMIELIKEIEGLNTAAETRGVIEQAKGVIMRTVQCGPDAAFAVLVAQSQHQNRKLRDIAAELVAMQDHQPPSPQS